jgi:hypothetical protein
MPRLERLPKAPRPETKPQNPDRPAEMDFEDAQEVARAMLEARKILKHYLDQEPKLKEVLETPQSADKHAEGPRILDHYKHILTSLLLLKRGFFTFERASQALDLADRRGQWESAVRFVQENYDLMLAFAICHDLAKPDALGLYAKSDKGLAAGFPAKREFHLKNKKMPLEERKAWSEKYALLEAEFAKSHPEMTDPAVRQKAFFDEYGITATYVGHENVTPENRAIIDRVCGELGLSEKDVNLLVYSIQNHVSGHLSFEKGPRDYHALAKLAEAAGVDPKRGMMSLLAGMVVDGMMGVRKWNAPGTGYELPSEAIVKFWDAELAYPGFLAEEERKAKEQAELLRLRAAADAADLRGDKLRSLGLNLKIGFSTVVDAIFDAIREDRGLDRQILASVGVKEDIIDEIERRLAKAREFFKESAQPKNPFADKG